MNALLKSIVCAIIALFPAERWPLASRLIRQLWPGFADA
jgi:hypothetical protein